MTNYLQIAEEFAEMVDGSSTDGQAHAAVYVAAMYALLEIAQDLKRIAERMDREPVDWRKGQ